MLHNLLFFIRNFLHDTQLLLTTLILVRHIFSMSLLNLTGRVSTGKWFNFLIQFIVGFSSYSPHSLPYHYLIIRPVIILVMLWRFGLSNNRKSSSIGRLCSQKCKSICLNTALGSLKNWWCNILVSTSIRRRSLTRCARRWHGRQDLRFC